MRRWVAPSIEWNSSAFALSVAILLLRLCRLSNGSIQPLQSPKNLIFSQTSGDQASERLSFSTANHPLYSLEDQTAANSGDKIHSVLPKLKQRDPSMFQRSGERSKEESPYKSNQRESLRSQQPILSASNESAAELLQRFLGYEKALHGMNSSAEWTIEDNDEFSRLLYFLVDSDARRAQRKWDISNTKKAWAVRNYATAQQDRNWGQTYQRTHLQYVQFETYIWEFDFANFFGLLAAEIAKNEYKIFVSRGRQNEGASSAEKASGKIGDSYERKTTRQDGDQIVVADSNLTRDRYGNDFLSEKHQERSELSELSETTHGFMNEKTSATHMAPSNSHTPLYAQRSTNEFEHKQSQEKHVKTTAAEANARPSVISNGRPAASSLSVNDVNKLNDMYKMKNIYNTQELNRLRNIYANEIYNLNLRDVYPNKVHPLSNVKTGIYGSSTAGGTYNVHTLTQQHRSYPGVNQDHVNPLLIHSGGENVPFATSSNFYLVIPPIKPGEILNAIPKEPEEMKQIDANISYLVESFFTSDFSALSDFPFPFFTGGELWGFQWIATIDSNYDNSPVIKRLNGVKIQITPLSGHSIFVFPPPSPPPHSDVSQQLWMSEEFLASNWPERSKLKDSLNYEKYYSYINMINPLNISTTVKQSYQSDPRLRFTPSSLSFSSPLISVGLNSDVPAAFYSFEVKSDPTQFYLQTQRDFDDRENVFKSRIRDFAFEWKNKFSEKQNTGTFAEAKFAIPQKAEVKVGGGWDPLERPVGTASITTPTISLQFSNEGTPEVNVLKINNINYHVQFREGWPILTPTYPSR